VCGAFNAHVTEPESSGAGNYFFAGAGNYFFAGARTFFRSLEAAIFLFSRVARLPAGSAVIPAISTDERITLGAHLADGQRLRGQNIISHPPICAGTSAVCKDGACCPGALEASFSYLL
jgi:hypothetical protein